MPAVRKHIEMNLMGMAEHYKRLAEDMPVFVVAFQPDGTLTFANDLIAKEVGMSPEQLIGKNFLNFLSVEDQKLTRERLALLTPEQPVETHEQSYLTENGEYTHHQWTNRAFFDAAGNLASVQAIGEDITERKAADDALRRSEAQLKESISLLHATIESTNDAILVVDMNKKWVLHNNQFVKLWHIPNEVISAKDDAAALSYVLDQIENPEAFLNKVRELYETPEANSFDTFKFKDGKIIERLSIPQRIDNKVIGRVWCFRDITKRELIEKELRNTYTNLLSAQKLAQIGSWDWDVHNNAANWSDETYRIFGITKNILSEHRENFLDMILPEDRSLVDKALSEALDGTNEYNIVYRVSLVDGTLKIIHALAEVVRDSEGKPLLMQGTVQDITLRKLAEERIDKLANFDQLTELPNRTMLNDHFKFALSLAQRSGEPLAVMFLDLDHFKDINDTLGHSIGDQLLMAVAKRLKTALREEDTLSRQGGDEFILILPGSDADGAALVAAKLIEVVSEPCHIEQHELIVTPSIGIAIYPHDGESLELLSKNADTAMYRAKDVGRNNFRFFTPEMQTQSARNLKLANALRHALERNELFLHYQPQLSIEDSHIVGAEALLRWQHPELGKVSPAEFIPIAEDTGQIIQIGEWVLRTAAKQLKDWIDAGMNPITMAVNLSAVQFRQQGLTELVVSILDEIKLPHELLELELTEAAMMDNPLDAIDVMTRLHDQGIRMSIDDFGTGYSSLSYLKQFKVYKLKIDQSFVRDIAIDIEDKAIVTAIINMATSLGMQTIAEGVETADQLAFLRLQGCHEVQGYYFSKPLSVELFEVFARKN
jgi:diguanylate cyclase (GGDEF)-like protein/PAS domain S-box-containing protein